MTRRKLCAVLLSAGAVLLADASAQASRVPQARYRVELYQEARQAALDGGLDRAETLWRKMLGEMPEPLYSVDLATACGEDAAIELLDELRAIHPVIALPEDEGGCRRILFGFFPEENGIDGLVPWLPSVSLYPPTLVRIEGADHSTFHEIRQYAVTARATAPAARPSAESEAAREEARRLFEEGRRALLDRDLARAEQAFRGVLANDDENVGAMQNLGAVLLYQERYDEAATWFEHAIAADPAYVKAYTNLAAARFAQERPEEALRILQRAAALTPDDFEVQYTLAAMSAETGRFEDAWRHLDIARDLQPGDQRAEALARALPPREAPPEAPASEARIPDSRLAAGPRPAQGMFHAPGEVPEEALSSQPEPEPETSKPRRAVPTEADRLFQQGVRAYERGALRKAERDLREAARLDPANPNIHNNLGAVYVEQSRWGDAEAAFQRALSADPEHVKARVNLGGVFYNEGRRDEALQILQEARALSPDDPDVLYTLALFLTHADRRDEAREIVASALPKAPFHGKLRALEELLASPIDRMYVAEPEIFLRQDPSRNASVVGKIRFGQPVQVLQRRGDWLRVRVGQEPAVEGWVGSEMVSQRAPAAASS